MKGVCWKTQYLKSRTSYGQRWNRGGDSYWRQFWQPGSCRDEDYSDTLTILAKISLAPIMASIGRGFRRLLSTEGRVGNEGRKIEFAIEVYLIGGDDNLQTSTNFDILVPLQKGTFGRPQAASEFTE